MSEVGHHERGSQLFLNQSHIFQFSSSVRQSLTTFYTPSESFIMLSNVNHRLLMVIVFAYAIGLTTSATTSSKTIDITSSTSQPSTSNIVPIRENRESKTDNFVLNLIRLLDTSQLRSSIKTVSRSAVTPIMYGLSFAATLAALAGFSDSRPLSRIFATEKQRPDPEEDQMTSASNHGQPTIYSPVSYTSNSNNGFMQADPVVQKFLTTKDGQQHYHHIFHYHVPYPAASSTIGSYQNQLKSLESMVSPRSQTPFQLPWYTQESQNSMSGKPILLSAFYNQGNGNQAYRRSSTKTKYQPTLDRNDYLTSSGDQEPDTNSDDMNLFGGRSAGEFGIHSYSDKKSKRSDLELTTPDDEPISSDTKVIAKFNVSRNERRAAAAKKA